MYNQGVISLLVCVSLIVGKQTDKYLNQCSSKVSCSECIQTPNCAWCYQTGFKGVRCFNPSMVKDGTGGCDVKSIYNPDSVRLVETINNKELSRAKNHKQPNINKDDEASDGSEQTSYASDTAYKYDITSEGSIYTTITTDNEDSNTSEGSTISATDAVTKHARITNATDDLIQLKPQKAQLQLRKGKTLKLEFAYSQAQDYPVDLYYLMDLSSSMKDDKEKLSTLGKLLSSTMKNITSNFRIGFGSFVEKVVMPYVSMVRLTPCEQCPAPYGYKNQMSLSSDTDLFEEAVMNSAVSGNLDAPEGGFDALMQAIVCKEEIGWRDNARKLLIFSSDDSSHFAGDGKLGGVVKPNDGECHMENHIYTHSNLQDYPSISQINNKVKEHSVNIIFAVTAKQLRVYNHVKNLIQGSGIGVLSHDSSNITDLVQQQYNKITSTVEMKDNSSDAVRISYYSSCLGQGRVQKTNKCEGLKTGDVVEFTAEITLESCPKDPKDWKQIFALQPVGISESLMIEIDMYCDCPCQRSGNDTFSQASSVCNDMGTLECGVCICNSGRLGKHCQCSTEDDSVDHESGCRPSNLNRGPLCSNRGNCFCGQCECNKLIDPTKEISGRYCECDNFSCDLYNNTLCSGPDHGRCICGRCECAPEFTGFACQCTTSNETCISPENGEVCSGNGRCECGKCVCNSNKEQYYGDYCKCLTCSGSCSLFRDCVLCEVHKKGPMYGTDTSPYKACGNCSLSPQIEKGESDKESNMEYKTCTLYDNDGCLYTFKYSYDQKQRLTILAQEDLQCPQKLNTLTIVLTVIGCVVVPGLVLLLVWKIATLIHDKREFVKFEKERKTAKWNKEDNPLYKQPTSTFSNPSYEQVCD